MQDFTKVELAAMANSALEQKAEFEKQLQARGEHLNDQSERYPPGYQAIVSMPGASMMAGAYRAAGTDLQVAVENAIRTLNQNGHPVTKAEGIPGLYDVANVGRDLTIGQLLDVASKVN